MASIVGIGASIALGAVEVEHRVLDLLARHTTGEDAVVAADPDDDIAVFYAKQASITGRATGNAIYVRPWLVSSSHKVEVRWGRRCRRHVEMPQGYRCL